jgi:hypothetical protein
VLLGRAAGLIAAQRMRMSPMKRRLLLSTTSLATCLTALRPNLILTPPTLMRLSGRS